MKFIEFDSENLIDFYCKNGLEFYENKKYFGTDLRSFALVDNDKIIGAITISKYKEKILLKHWQ